MCHDMLLQNGQNLLLMQSRGYGDRKLLFLVNNPVSPNEPYTSSVDT